MVDYVLRLVARGEYVKSKLVILTIEPEFHPANLPSSESTVRGTR